MKQIKQMSPERRRDNMVAAVEALRKKKLATCLDPYQLDSRPTGKQEEFLQDVATIQYRYLVAGNRSGKTMCAAREIAWFLTDTHPYADRTELWGHQPLFIIIAGQDLNNIGKEIWANKIKPLIPNIDEKTADGLSVWKEERQGNTIKSVINRNTGDTLLFLSHGDGSEKNRKHIQGYTAHIVWCDEMPSSMAILQEIESRILGKTNSRFMATFTPSPRSAAIRKKVDGASLPFAKKYSLSMLDNPGLSEKVKRAKLDQLKTATAAERNRILFGEWGSDDNAVYQFDFDTMTVPELPSHYSKSGWRHVVSVDPASKSKCGFTLWAEDPKNGTWYLVSDEYLKGDRILDPDNLVTDIEARLAGYNVVRRVSDTMAWFIGRASARGVAYTQPYNKNSRKEELIKGLQTELSHGRVKILATCTAFLDEVENCRYKEGDTLKIVNSSIYHTLDASQYFVDCKPKYDPSIQPKSWDRKLADISNEYYEKQRRRTHSKSKMRVRW